MSKILDRADDMGQTVEKPVENTVVNLADRKIHTPIAIRQVELPRSFRGFDETATRELLARIADSVHALTNERDELKKRVAELDRGGDGAKAPQAAETPEAPQSVSSTLLSATRVAEELLNDAHAEAERVKADAQAETDRMLEDARQASDELAQELEMRHAELEGEQKALSQAREERQAELDSEREALLESARDEADRMTGAAQRRVDELEAETAQLREAIAETHQRFAELTRTALEQLSTLGAEAEETAGGSSSGSLVDDLHPGPTEPSGTKKS